MKLKVRLFALLFIPFFSILAQETPISLELQKHVDLFTGDLNYNIPLVSLTGPNGESFPINARYRSGIKTNQESSWIGLGWYLNLGEISREVLGFPDDWNGKSFQEKQLVEKIDFTNPNDPPNLTQLSTTENIKAYGPLYFKDLDYSATNPYSKMDLFASWRGVEDKSPFEFPDYDKYYVSGPGIGGELSAYLFDFANLYQKSEATLDGNITYGNPSASNYKKISKEVQFRMKGDGIFNLDVPYYGTSNQYLALADETLSGTDFSWSNNTLHIWNSRLKKPSDIPNLTGVQAIHKDWNGDINNSLSTSYGQRKRLRAGYFIEYFTNEEINRHYDNSDPHTISNFLDYKEVTSSNPRPSAQFDPDGIGAFRITTPSGMIYHYSLPIYVHNETNTSFDYLLDNSTGNYTIDLEDRKDTVTYNYINDMYAKSWKLTAITAVDFEDANGNNFADGSDKGYWIRINYEKWNKENYEYLDREPLYGSNIDFTRNNSPAIAKKRLSYNLNGSVREVIQDEWYPNYIKSSSHTLYFIKDIKNDNRSLKNSTNTNSIPRLILSRIILLKNDDIINNSIFQSYGTSVSNPYFSASLNSMVNKDKILMESDYTLVQSTIDPLTLKNIEFVQDYSLAKGAYSNIRNTPTTTNVNTGDNDVFVFEDITGITKNYGKLTLTAINIYDFGKIKDIESTRNSYQFQYNYNPDYNHKTVDYHGNYKKPKSSISTSYFNLKGYTTSYSKDFLDAWSLNEIITPNKSKILVEYEADEYTGVKYLNGYGEGGMRKPTRAFKIEKVSQGTGNSVNISFSTPDAADLFLGSNFSKSIRISYPHQNITRYLDVYRNASGSKKNDYELSISNLNGRHYPSINYSSAKGIMHLELNNAHGGGVRVKEISVQEEDLNQDYSLKIEYEDGYIGAEKQPFSLSFYDFIGNKGTTPSIKVYDRLAPSSSVGYSKVSLIPTGRIIDGQTTFEQEIGKIEYNFISNPDGYSIAHITGFKISEPPGGNKTYHVKEVIKVRDHYQTDRGKIKSIKFVDKNDKVLKTKTYNYEPYIAPNTTGQGIKPNKGFVQEAFYKTFNVSDYTVERVYLKEESHRYLCNVLIEEGNLKTRIEYLDHDKYTGIPLKSRTTYNNGKTFELEKQLAYKISNTNSFGPKSIDSLYSNRMVLPFYSQKTENPNSKEYYLRASSHKVKKLNSSGNFVFEDSPIDSWNLSKTLVNTSGESNYQNWDYSKFITLYDEHDNILESRNLLTYSAQEIESESQLPISTASNSNYSSFFHTSFENIYSNSSIKYFDSGIENGNLQTTNVTNITPHSGDYIASISSAQAIGPKKDLKVITEVVDNVGLHRGIIPGRTYELSVWMHTSSSDETAIVADIMGHSGTISQRYEKYITDPDNITIGDWVLVKLEFSLPGNFATITETDKVSVFVWNNSTQGPSPGFSFVDDFRLQPIDAQVKGIVYDKRRELAVEFLNNENFKEKLVYDAHGNVIETWMETLQGEKIVTEKIIHYAD